MDNELLTPEYRFSIIQGRLQELVAAMKDITDTIEDPTQSELMCENCMEKAYNAITEDQPWFEDGVLASVGHIATTELTKTGTEVIAKLGAIGVTKTLTKGVGKILLARFKTYTEIHPEIDPITAFDSAKYDLREASENHNIGFKLAMKWGEKIDTRVEVRVYGKKGKDAFAIAYGKQSSGAMYNTEFVLVDGRYKKHEEFYTASAHAHVGLGHPSIERLLKHMRAEYKELKAKQKEMVEKRVEESWEDGTFEEKKRNAATAYESGAISQGALAQYLLDMELAGIHPKNDWEPY